jgi:uncharacterized membrane protein
MRRQLVAALILALMFAAGAFTGHWWARRPQPPRLRSMTPGSTVLAETLGLSPAQQAAVDSILVDGQPEIDSISRDVQEQLREAIAEIERQVRMLLDSTQARMLDSLSAEGGIPLAPGTRLRRPPPR